MKLNQFRNFDARVFVIINSMAKMIKFTTLIVIVTVTATLYFTAIIVFIFALVFVAISLYITGDIF